MNLNLISGSCETIKGILKIYNKDIVGLVYFVTVGVHGGIFLKDKQ